MSKGEPMTDPVRPVAPQLDEAVTSILAAVARTQWLVDTNIIASGICHACWQPAPAGAIVCAHCYWTRAEK